MYDGAAVRLSPVGRFSPDLEFSGPGIVWQAPFAVPDKEWDAIDGRPKDIDDDSLFLSGASTAQEAQHLHGPGRGGDRRAGLTSSFGTEFGAALAEFDEVVLTGHSRVGQEVELRELSAAVDDAGPRTGRIWCSHCSARCAIAAVTASTSASPSVVGMVVSVGETIQRRPQEARQPLLRVRSGL
ncbi:hypothetical protein ACFV2X_41870 [Streptomyces sp. NPDC059679]|uniref:hypothetical protein n=1 Tax=Streptomyces sp. NPDC059679 TaxID=3346903 RepID=UPI0036BB78FC